MAQPKQCLSKASPHSPVFKYIFASLYLRWVFTLIRKEQVILFGSLQRWQQSHRAASLRPGALGVPHVGRNLPHEFPALLELVMLLHFWTNAGSRLQFLFSTCLRHCGRGAAGRTRRRSGSPLLFCLLSGKPSLCPTRSHVQCRQKGWGLLGFFLQTSSCWSFILKGGKFKLFFFLIGDQRRDLFV